MIVKALNCVIDLCLRHSSLLWCSCLQFSTKTILCYRRSHSFHKNNTTLICISTRPFLQVDWHILWQYFHVPTVQWEVIWLYWIGLATTQYLKQIGSKKAVDNQESRTVLESHRVMSSIAEFYMSKMRPLADNRWLSGCSIGGICHYEWHREHPLVSSSASQCSIWLKI